MSNERTEEATNARMRQNKHDRQIAELTLQITRLQQQSTDASNELKRKDSTRGDADVGELKNEIKELSEEILKSRGQYYRYVFVNSVLLSPQVNSEGSRLSSSPPAVPFS